MKSFATLDDEFKGYLKQLIETGKLEKGSGATSVGVVQTILNLGIENLSKKQIGVFYDYVLGKFVIEKCEICGDEIPWSYIINALKNGLCETCTETRKRVKEEKENKAKARK